MFDNPDLNRIRKAIADLRMMGINPSGLGRGVGSLHVPTLCGIPITLKD
jgi:hypothetical protein